MPGKFGNYISKYSWVMSSAQFGFDKQRSYLTGFKAVSVRQTPITTTNAALEAVPLRRAAKRESRKQTVTPYAVWTRSDFNKQQCFATGIIEGSRSFQLTCSISSFHSRPRGTFLSLDGTYQKQTFKYSGWRSHNTKHNKNGYQMVGFSDPWKMS